MKIAYSTHYFPPAGFAASENTYRIVKGLVERGHEVRVFCPQTFSKYTASSIQGENRLDSFEVYRAPSTPLSLSTTIPHLLNFLKQVRSDYDLVITQFHLFHLASIPGLLSKIIKKKPWIVKVHDMIPDPSLQRTFFERLFVDSSYGLFVNSMGKKVDTVMVLTKELRRLLIDNDHNPDKVAVVPNGVDTDVFHPASSKDSQSSSKTILYTGSIMPEDGVSNLIRAFSLVDEKEDVNLLVIGDGPERPHLIELARKLKLEKRVGFNRHVPHCLMPDLVRAAYITIGPLRVSPINTYTIPTKLLEYFSCGKTAVSAPVSRDILIDEFNGVIVKDITPESIAEKLTAMLEDEKLVVTMGKNARQFILERFDWEKIIDQIQRILLAS